MTNLEKVLGTALVVVKIYGAVLTIKAIKELKNDPTFCENLQEKANKIQNMLKKSNKEEIH